MAVQVEERQTDSPALDFELLIDQHQSMVFSLALRMTGDRGLAEELTQDVLLELDRNLERMRSGDHVRFWLRQVTMHRAVDALRRKNRRHPGWNEGKWIDLEESHGLPLDSLASGNAITRELEQMMGALPERQRAAILLRYQEDMTPEEIAATLRAPVATVKSHLQRGLKTLRASAQGRLKEYIRGQ